MSNGLTYQVRGPDLAALVSAQVRSEDVRLTLADRLSLRLALWLLVRSARRVPQLDRALHTRLVDEVRARDAREHFALRRHACNTVRS